MGKLKLSKRARLAALIASLLLFVISILGIVIFSLKLLYAPLVICIAVAIMAAYSVPFLTFGTCKNKE